ncbi:MAG: hypothetical protein ACOX1X_06240 [Dethiobacteria bacterium]
MWLGSTGTAPTAGTGLVVGEHRHGTNRGDGPRGWGAQAPAEGTILVAGVACPRGGEHADNTPAVRRHQPRGRALWLGSTGTAPTAGTGLVVGRHGTNRGHGPRGWGAQAPAEGTILVAGVACPRGGEHADNTPAVRRHQPRGRALWLGSTGTAPTAGTDLVVGEHRHGTNRGDGPRGWSR